MSDASMGQEEKAELLKHNSTTFFDTSFAYLKQHLGHRPGKMHLYIGPSGAGKSTLMRSLLIDLMESTPHPRKVLVWLSEESINDFKMELARSKYDDQLKLAHVTVVSELELPETVFDTEMYFNELCREHEVVIYDNITTSQMCMSKNFQQQSEFFHRIKKTASAANAALIIFAHTKKDAIQKNKILSIEDIRGNSTIVNLAEFCYVMQQFNVNDEVVSTIRILKHRGFSNVVEKIFKFYFIAKVNLYTLSAAIRFKGFKDTYKNQDKI